jgi:hypothetical protein
MQKELINDASKLFPSFEHWQSFLELSESREHIKEFWFVEATNKIRRHFMETLPPEWDCERWGATSRDTRWFLREFGSDSLSVCFAWCYQLHLILHNHQKFNAQSVARLLKESGDYRPIHLAFDRIDQPHSGSELREMRNFKFGTAHDGNFSEWDLAWHAGNRTETFVDQAIAKIERFTKSPEVTELLRQLNQTALNESQGTKT